MYLTCRLIKIYLYINICITFNILNICIKLYIYKLYIYSNHYDDFFMP